MDETLDDTDPGTLADQFRNVRQGGRALDAARMLESISTKLFDDGGTVTVGRFEVRERLGAGGMGVVMSAFDPQLQRTVAVKVLHDEGDPNEHKRLLDEARAMAKVRHPNLVAVYDAGTYDNAVFIAMEYVEGGTLGEWMKAEARSWRDVVEVFKGAARGLAAIHDAGMVHRDFKPDNVLLGEDGRAQVSDFGLARPEAAALSSSHLELSEDGSADATQSRGVTGTPNYLSPEQWKGKRADAASDQWSFCVALHEALYGRRPFEGDTAAELCSAVLTGERSPPDPDRGSAVPRWLSKIIDRGLSRDAAQRFSSMHALAAALESGLDDRRRLTLRAAAVATLATAGVAGAATLLIDDKPCQGVDARLLEAWTPPRQTLLEARFGEVKGFGADTWQRVQARIDERVEGWAAQRRDACNARHVRGELSEDAFDLRMRCLDRRALELESLLDTFLSIDARGVESALRQLDQQVPLQTCEDLEFLRLTRPTPESPEEREAVAALRRKVTRFDTATRGSDLTALQEDAKALVAEAEALGYEPALAEALLSRAKVESLLGRGTVAAELYEQAFEHALASHHVKVQIWASVVATFVFADQVRDPEAAARWGGQARALLRAHPRFERARRALETNLGVAAFYAEDFDEARKHLLEAIRLYDEAGLGESMDAIGPLANLGVLERTQGNLEASMARLLEAQTKARTGLGENHPMVGSLATSLAITYEKLERFDEVEAQYRLSLRILEARLGKDKQPLGHPLNNLGAFFLQRGRPQDALPHLSRAIDIWTKEVGDDYVLLPDPLRNRGEALLELGRHAQARTDLERARELTPADAKPDARARGLFLLARAYAPTDLERAKSLADEASRVKSSDTALEAEIQAWLAAHP